MMHTDWEGWPDPNAVWRSPWLKRWRWKRFCFEQGRWISAGYPDFLLYWEWKES